MTVTSAPAGSTDTTTPDEGTGEAPATTTAATDGAAPTTTAATGEWTYPLSFSDAEELGVVDQIDWGDRCDTSTGVIAVPDFFAPE